MGRADFLSFASFHLNKWRIADDHLIIKTRLISKLVSFCVLCFFVVFINCSFQKCSNIDYFYVSFFHIRLFKQQHKQQQKMCAFKFNFVVVVVVGSEIIALSA